MRHGCDIEGTNVTLVDMHTRLRPDQVRWLKKNLPPREFSQWIREAVDEKIERNRKRLHSDLASKGDETKLKASSVPNLETLNEAATIVGHKIDVVRYGGTCYTRKLRAGKEKKHYFFVRLPNKLIKDWGLQKGTHVKILHSYYHPSYDAWGVLLLFLKC
jgi:hypothetical protein